MENQEIEFEITSEGKVTIRTIGIKGSKCLDVAEEIVQFLGREEERQLTAEYYESEQSISDHLRIHDKFE